MPEWTSLLRSVHSGGLHGSHREQLLLFINAAPDLHETGRAYTAYFRGTEVVARDHREVDHDPGMRVAAGGDNLAVASADELTPDANFAQALRRGRFDG